MLFIKLSWFASFLFPFLGWLKQVYFKTKNWMFSPIILWRTLHLQDKSQLHNVPYDLLIIHYFSDKHIFVPLNGSCLAVIGIMKRDVLAPTHMTISFSLLVVTVVLVKKHNHMHRLLNQTTFQFPAFIIDLKLRWILNTETQAIL